MASTDTIVIDQGGEYDVERNNYDHHQFPLDEMPECSITLILPLLGINEIQARRSWDWLEFSEVLDSRGPRSAAELISPCDVDGNSITITHEDFMMTVSPIETVMLQLFSECFVITEGTALWHLMRRIGHDHLELLTALIRRRVLLERDAHFVKIAGVYVLDATCVDCNSKPELGLDRFIMASEHTDCAITVTLDDRPDADGYTLYRRDDHPKVDFSRLAGLPGVIHTAPFIAKITKEADPLEMILAAVEKDEEEDHGGANK
jgi:hypothetical protein